MNEILISLSAQITEVNAEISSDLSACETINYPKVHLENIILNLLTNALKYSSPDCTPKISNISNKQENGLITLTCKNNGLGIDSNRYGR